MKELLVKIETACGQYFGKELDDAGFQKVIDEIPIQLWQEKDSALAIVKALVENEDLYEVSLEKRKGWAEFVCQLLPNSFWENKENIMEAAVIICDFMERECEGPSRCDIEPVFAHITPALWDDDKFATAAANLVIERAYSMYDLDCISELIPESVWKNENDLRWVVLRIYNADERNMNALSLFPDKAWESPKMVSLILSCLIDALEIDRSWGTVYCNFRGSDEHYLANFLSHVPVMFKSDKAFVLDILEYDYFLDGFVQVYDWMDQSLWLDKDFVMKILERDPNAVIRVPNELAADEAFLAYIDENIDLEWMCKHIPQDKIPQWIKDKM